MSNLNQQWNGDVNEAVVEEWTAETTPFERVREILLSTTTPRYAKVIADRARVSEPTARNHLRTLVDAGAAETVDTGRGTQYKRSRQTVAMQRISELHAELSRDELTAGIKELRNEIQEYQNEYDATDPDDLVLQLDAEGDEEWMAVSEWRATEENLDIAKAALALYDFDPNDSDNRDHTAGDDRSASGAFARDRDELSA